jgi:hypothetical protein
LILGLDDYAIVELVIILEEEFGVTIEDEEAIGLESVTELVLLFNRYYSNKKNRFKIANMKKTEFMTKV